MFPYRERYTCPVKRGYTHIPTYFPLPSYHSSYQASPLAPMQNPLTIYAPRSEPYLTSADTAQIHEDLAIIAARLSEMKQSLQTLDNGLLGLYDGIYKMSCEPCSYDSSGFGESDPTDSHYNNTNDAEISSTSEPTPDYDGSDHGRTLDRQVLPHDLRSGFCHLASNISDAFQELINVFKAAQKVQDPKMKANLHRTLNVLHYRLYIVKQGIADIHQDLAVIDLGPRGWFEDKVNDYNVEIEALKMKVAQETNVADGSTAISRDHWSHA